MSIRLDIQLFSPSIIIYFRRLIILKNQTSNMRPPSTRCISPMLSALFLFSLIATVFGHVLPEHLRMDAGFMSLNPHVGPGLVDISGKDVSDDPTLSFCRLSMGFTRCAERSVGSYNGTQWCESHMCAPSYISAEPCDDDTKLRADSKCRVIETYEGDGPKLGWLSLIHI